MENEIVEIISTQGEWGVWPVSVSGIPYGVIYGGPDYEHVWTHRPCMPYPEAVAMCKLMNAGLGTKRG